MSEIVLNFYSPLERIGLKKHSFNDAEINFLDSKSKLDQMKLWNDELKYMITRVNNIFILFRKLSLILFITGLAIITITWVTAVILIVSALITFRISNYFSTRLWILQTQRGFFYCVKRDMVNELFK